MDYYRFDANDPMYDDADEVAYYMHPEYGSIDTYEGWNYEDEDGETHNAVDEGLVFEVNRVKDEDGNYHWEPA